MKKNIIFSWLLAVLALTNISCQKEEIPETDPIQEVSTKDHLVSATPLATYDKFTLQILASTQGFSSLAADIKYDIQVFNIVYLTTYKGTEIQASGLLAVPVNANGALPILSGQHGTTFEQNDVPTSNYPATSNGFELFAAAGYMTVIPDFIGYGASKQYFHPYYDQKHSALAVIDLIKAAKSYAGKNALSLNNKLFLVGYSEGGYVTMAAQKEIEINPEHNLTVTAAAAGAGGFDLTGMLSEISADKEYTKPSYLAFILQSYNKTYGWNRPLTDFFKEPYASLIPTLFNGTTSAGKINSSLSFDPNQLFNATFYANLKKPDGELALKKALVDNTLYTNWYPKSPTKIYQGTADESVFFQNSKSTYDHFVAAGAKNIEFISITGGTHSSSITPMLVSVVPWFKSLK